MKSKQNTMLSILMMLSSFLSIGQEQFKEWSNEPLTWNYFLGKKISNTKSNLNYVIEYDNNFVEKKDNLKIIRSKSIGKINTEISFVNLKYKNEKHLKFNQVNFNLV
jgi:hypothetical protein